MAEWPPFYTSPYVPFSLGMGSLFALSGEPTDRVRPALGFAQSKMPAAAQQTECSSAVPCGWCRDCLGQGEETVTTVTVTAAQHGVMNPDGTWIVEEWEASDAESKE